MPIFGYTITKVSDSNAAAGDPIALYTREIRKVMPPIVAQGLPYNRFKVPPEVPGDKSDWRRIVGKEVKDNGCGYLNESQCGDFLKEVLEKKLYDHPDPSLASQFQKATVTARLARLVLPLALVDAAQQIAYEVYSANYPPDLVA